MKASSSVPGQDLYRRAKEIIPGGTQLLSKRPEMMAPESWPPYYREAKGCEITDVDGRRFLDFYTMGIGSCLLGYAHPEVNEAVIETVRRGSMSSLNTPMEVELAETLLEIHPWAESVRYARTGGESMTLAIRIARSSTGKSRVAFCGYHGWHDWYIAANLGDDNALEGQLMPGLSPHGVPRELSRTALGFHFNQIDQVEKLIAEHGRELAAIVMEPMRFVPPKDDFLSRVAKLAAKNGIVLIFDEITTGWRYCLGGVHMQFGVEPDIAVFAKALSNGFPMAAVIGKKAVMTAAEQSFISSTYWTEATGPAAALATIRAMKKENIWETIRAASKRVAEGLRGAAKKTGLPIKLIETEAMVSLAFDLGAEANVARTLYTTLMLEKGYLAGSAFYATSAHTPDKVGDFLVAMEEAFGTLAQYHRAGELRQSLKTPEAHHDFRRLTG